MDIWIAPGVTLDYNPPSYTYAAPTISDDGQECHCKIYGTGVIKNTFEGTTGFVYECIKTTHQNTTLSVECDYIEGIGGTNLSSLSNQGTCINVNSDKFDLSCNRVFNQRHSAIFLGLTSNTVNVNIDITKVETGIVGQTSTGTTAIISKSNGFITIGEILCNNLGHCLSHRRGTVTARIEKMTTVMNNSGFGNISTVHLSAGQGSTSQKMILYFDEINCLNGASNNALCGIEFTIGTGIFIGMRVYSEILSTLDGATIQIGGANIKGYLKCDNVTSPNHVALILNDSNEQITIDVNSVEFGGAAGIFSNGSVSNRGKFFIRNAKIKSISQSTSAKGIFFNNIYPVFTLNNLKIISGSDNNSNIFLGNNTIDVFNLGWFGNSGIDQTKIIQKVGIGIDPMDMGYNYQTIIDPLLD